MPTTTIKPTRKAYENWLNSSISAINKKAVNANYGTWLKISNPLVFNAGFLDYIKNN
jgi:hypothetical protein